MDVEHFLNYCNGNNNMMEWSIGIEMKVGRCDLGPVWRALAHRIKGQGVLSLHTDDHDLNNRSLLTCFRSKEAFQVSLP